MSSGFKEKHYCLYLQCTCVHSSQQAGMPTFQIVPTLHLNIALLALWGHHSRCKTNPLKQNTCTCVQLLVQYRHTEIKYKCKPSYCLKFMGICSLWGKGGERSYTYVVNMSGLIVQVLSVMVISFCRGAVI